MVTTPYLKLFSVIIKIKSLHQTARHNWANQVYTKVVILDQKLV